MGHGLESMELDDVRAYLRIGCEPRDTAGEGVDGVEDEAEHIRDELGRQVIDK